MNQDISTVQNAILNELRRLEYSTRDLLKVIKVNIESSKLKKEESEYEDATPKADAKDLEPIKEDTKRKDKKFKMTDLMEFAALVGAAGFPDIASFLGFGEQEPSAKDQTPQKDISPKDQIPQKDISPKDQIPQKDISPKDQIPQDDPRDPRSRQRRGYERRPRPSYSYQDAQKISLSNQQIENNKDFAMKFFINEGFTPEQAAGIVGNLIAESNLNPKGYSKEGGNKGARGIAQWRGSRIEDFIRVIGKDPLEASLQEQLTFIMWELTESPTEKPRGALKALLNAQTAEEAAIKWEEKYERANRQHLQKRIDNAKTLIEEYAPATLQQPTAMRDLSSNKRSKAKGTIIVDARQNNYITSSYKDNMINYIPTRDSVYSKYKSLA